MCRKIIFVYGFSNILNFSRMFCLCLFLSFIGRFFLPLFLVSVEWNREYVYIATGSICVYSEKCLCWFFFSLSFFYINICWFVYLIFFLFIGRSIFIFLKCVSKKIVFPIFLLFFCFLVVIAFLVIFRFVWCWILAINCYFDFIRLPFCMSEKKTRSEINWKFYVSLTLSFSLCISSVYLHFVEIEWNHEIWLN